MKIPLHHQSRLIVAFIFLLSACTKLTIPPVAIKAPVVPASPTPVLAPTSSPVADNSPQNVDLGELIDPDANNGPFQIQKYDFHDLMDFNLQFLNISNDLQQQTKKVDFLIKQDDKVLKTVSVPNRIHDKAVFFSNNISSTESYPSVLNLNKGSIEFDVQLGFDPNPETTTTACTTLDGKYNKPLFGLYFQNGTTYADSDAIIFDWNILVHCGIKSQGLRYKIKKGTTYPDGTDSGAYTYSKIDFPKWAKDDVHKLALSWNDEVSIYIDGQLWVTGGRRYWTFSESVLKYYFQEAALSKAVMRFNSVADGFKIRSVRVYNEPYEEAMKLSGSTTFKEIPVGRFHAEARLFDSNNQLLQTYTVPFLKPSIPEWQSSPKVFPDKLIPPWTPVTVSNQSVSCWGRNYRFDQTPLPAQIISQGREILATPIQLNTIVNGSPVSWASKAFQWTDRTDTHAVLKTELASGSLRLSGITTIEFDGMVRADLTLSDTQAGSKNIDSLSLEIPFTKDNATFVHASGNMISPSYPYWDGWQDGSVPQKTVVGAFTPYIWLGNDQRGLGWFTESQKQWSNSDQKDVIELIPAPDRMTLKIKVIDKQVKLTDPLRYTFAFQASPIKPQQQKKRMVWNSWYYDHKKVVNTTVLEVSRLEKWKSQGFDMVLIHDNWNDIFNYPDPGIYSDVLKAYSKEAHRLGLKLLLYLGMQLGNTAPEYKLFKDEFVTQPWTKESGYERWGIKGLAYKVTPDGPYRNFMLHKLEQLIKEYDVDGFFLDFMGTPLQDANLSLNRGYIDREGKVQGVLPYFAYREWLKSVRMLGNSLKPDFFWLDSNGGTFPPLAQGFVADSSLSGEQLMWMTYSRTDLSIKPFLSEDLFRATMSGISTGMQIDAFTKDIGSDDYAMLAMALLHNVEPRMVAPPFPENFNEQYLKILHTLDEFKNGYWIPYFDANIGTLVRASLPNTRVSAYQQQDGSVLLVMVNFGTEASVAENIELRLPVSGSTQIWDPLEGTFIPHTGTIVQLSLTPWHVKMLKIMP